MSNPSVHKFIIYMYIGTSDKNKICDINPIFSSHEYLQLLL